MTSPRVLLRVYGVLNEIVTAPLRGRDSDVALGAPRSVKDLVESCGVPHVEVGRVLVDGEETTLARVLHGGERVSVYPHLGDLEGGEPAAPRFLLDGHLGRLAAYLRALGIDAARDRDAADDAIAARAEGEDRVVLSRDVGLLKRAAISRGHLVRATDPRAQLDEVVRRYRLREFAAPFTRCLRCNELLESATRDSVLGVVPARVLERHTEFSRCLGCAGVYWRGTHHAVLARLVGAVLA